MWQYLLKRLALLLVTWFGIAVICFLMMMLAPGDPAAMKAQSLATGRSVTISEFVLRKNRELFYLDRPLFLNWRPHTRTRTTLEQLAGLRGKEKMERDDAKAKLVSIGAAGLDLMVAELPAALERATRAREERRALLAGLQGALGAGDAALRPQLQALSQALPQYLPRISGASGGAPTPEERARAWLVQRDVLLEQAEDELRALLEVLTAVAGSEAPAVPEGADPSARVAAWQAWWAKAAPDCGGPWVQTTVAQWMQDGSILAREDEPPGAPLQALDRCGTRAAPALMAIYKGAREGSPEEQKAAWGLARVCKKPWDLTTSEAERRAWEVEWEEKKGQLEAEAAEKGLSPEALARRLKALGEQAEYVARQEREESELHRYRWRDWWHRAEEQYVDFGPARQAVRAVTQTQFGRWMGRFLRFDFGESYQTKRPVGDMLLERFPRTLLLEAISICLAYLVAIPLGIYSATHHGKLGDRVSSVVLFLLYSIPSFWAGAMLILLLTPAPFPPFGFSSPDADQLSRGGQVWDVAWHLVLPVLVLTYGQLAYESRLMRTGMLEAVRQDYVRTARAKGLSEGVVIYKHALRNALIPVLTILGSTLPLLFAGSVIVETVFTIDGLGKLFLDAILQRDYPVIMANLVISALLTLVGYLLSDISYALVDPRIEFR